MFDQPSVVALAFLFSLVTVGFVFVSIAVWLAHFKEKQFWSEYYEQIKED